MTAMIFFKETKTKPRKKDGTGQFFPLLKLLAPGTEKLQGRQSFLLRDQSNLLQSCSILLQHRSFLLCDQSNCFNHGAFCSAIGAIASLTELFALRSEQLLQSRSFLLCDRSNCFNHGAIFSAIGAIASLTELFSLRSELLLQSRSYFLCDRSFLLQSRRNFFNTTASCCKNSAFCCNSEVFRALHDAISSITLLFAQSTREKEGTVTHEA
jgi:hypothetical protein